MRFALRSAALGLVLRRAALGFALWSCFALRCAALGFAARRRLALIVCCACHGSALILVCFALWL